MAISVLSFDDRNTQMVQDEVDLTEGESRA